MCIRDRLNTAAGMLPAVGFAILMKYLPIREYGVFMIFGFAAASYPVSYTHLCQ